MNSYGAMLPTFTQPKMTRKKYYKHNNYLEFFFSFNNYLYVVGIKLQMCVTEFFLEWLVVD